MPALHTVVVAAPEQVSCDLDGEVAILDLDKGVYYGLDEVGARIWRELQQPRAVSTLKQALLDEYDVDPDTCERDLCALLDRLIEVGLARVIT